MGIKTTDGQEFICEFDYTLSLIGGKWKGLVLWHLQSETKRYNEIKKELGTITQKMLTQTLRNLEEDKLITRKVYPVVPPKVEYTITERGSKLIPIFSQLIEWGNEVAKNENILIDESF